MELSGVVTSIGTLVTGMMSWIGSYVGAITTSTNGLLLAFVLTPAIFWALGAIRRIMRHV